MNTENLEEIIKKYSMELLELSRAKHIEDEKYTEKTEHEETSEQKEEIASREKEISAGGEDGKDTAEKPQMEEPTVIAEQSEEAEIYADGEKTDEAFFLARVSYGEGAFPVEGAKVIVYRDDRIFAFLETDGSGNTKRVSLPAYPVSNSLDKDSLQQSVEYYADVLAEGFIPQRALTVSAVGGSEILLDVNAVPEEERFS